MAEVVDNLLFRGTSGLIGGQFVLRRLMDGRTVICKKPNFSTRKMSKEQKSHQQRFKEAAAYAKYMAKREPIYAEMAAGTMKNAYNVALGDWFNPPVIHKVERQGELIRIEASDDVRVVSVKVKIMNAEGAVLEQGEAQQVEKRWWSYAPQGPLEGGATVAVEASDLARNVVRVENGEW
jgi:hypothetical protein